MLTTLERERAWLRKHRARLLRCYADEYVARYGIRDIYMPRVKANESIARIRSPRIAKL